MSADLMTSVHRQYQGSEWLTGGLARRSRPAPSALGLVVADILGEAWAGIYHLSNTALFSERTEWQDKRCVIVTVANELANHDGAELTHLVLLAHAHGIRLAIKGAAPGYLRLQFTDGPNVMFTGRVPTPDEVLGRFHTRYDMPSAVAP